MTLSLGNLMNRHFDRILQRFFVISEKMSFKIEVVT